MKKFKYWILFVFFILLLVWGFKTIGTTIYIKYTGEKIVATVSKTPILCDRYNHINVLFDGIEYEVSISRSDCTERVYKVGQKVSLLKCKKYQEFVWPESQPELLPLLIIAILFLSYIVMAKQYKK